MKIHHYTTIETLALILKNRTIRFNRLDRVDDLEESEYGSSEANIKMGKYHFVSCWTKDDTENIALWGLYTKYKGVRISVDDNMFVTYPINNNFTTYFPNFLETGDNYLITAVVNEAKLIDVKYVDDLKSKIKELGNYTEDSSNGKFSIEMSNEFGILKSKQWEFQKESRFKISVLPIKQCDPNKYKYTNNNFDILNDNLSSISLALMEGQYISKEYFDIKLNDFAFQNIDILLGPQTTESEKIIVESLIKSFCPSATLLESIFMGKIRYKGTF